MSEKPAYMIIPIVLVLMLGAAAACAPAPALVQLAPTPPPLTLPTLIPPTRIPFTPTTIPTPTFVPPTATATVIAQTVASPTVSVPATSTAIPTSAAAPTPARQAGLFVTGLRTQPDPPIRGPNLQFLVTFANGTGVEQNYRWLVHIYKADAPNKTFGETTRTNGVIPTGATEQASLGGWTLPLGGPCDYFFARVVWLNADNKATPFTTPDGKVFEKGVTICPP